MRGGAGVSAGGGEARAGEMGMEEGEDGVSYGYAMRCLERGLLLISTSSAAVASAGVGGVSGGLGGSGVDGVSGVAEGGEGAEDGAGAEERAKVGQSERDREARWKMTQVRPH